jgi:hypothetical protein
MKRGIHNVYVKNVTDDIVERELLGTMTRPMLMCFKYLRNTKRHISPRRHKMWLRKYKRYNVEFAYNLGRYQGYTSKDDPKDEQLMNQIKDDLRKDNVTATEIANYRHRKYRRRLVTR